MNEEYLGNKADGECQGNQGNQGIQGIQGLIGAVGPQGATGTSAADTIIVSTSTPNATQGGEKWIWFQI